MVIYQVPLANALQGLHSHTTPAALAATLPQQTVLIQAQAQPSPNVLGTTIAATLAGPSANGAYGNPQQLVSMKFEIISKIDDSIANIYFFFTY